MLCDGGLVLCAGSAALMHQPSPHSFTPQLPQYGGWAPPALQSDVPQSPVPYTPPSASRSRVRWDRLLLMALGLGLLAFGAWNALHGAEGTTTTGAGDAQTIVDGSGATAGAGAVGVTPPAISQSRAAPVRRAPATTARRDPMRPPGASGAARVRGVHATAARRVGAAGVGAANGRAVGRVIRPGSAAGAASTGGRSTVRGAGELPYTGLETWIAAILGILALGLGIAVHVNAVRIGMVAMLYRRGILLRPVECARLAQQRGLPRLRARLSRVLERLLEPPSRSGEFVSLRTLDPADLPR